MPQVVLIARQSTRNLMSDDHDKISETMKIENCGGGLNAGQSPPHPPSKKAATSDCS